MSTPDARQRSAGPSLVLAAKHVGQEIGKAASQRDRERIIPVAEMALVRNRNLQSARIPVAYGGPGATFAEFSEIMLELGAGDPNLAQSLQPHFVLVEWLKLIGSEAQRARIYREVLGGAIITNAFAERGTKTPGDFATRLSRFEGRYKLDGTKFYSTGSLIADQLYIIAIMDDGARALAIIPKDREGVTIDDDWDGMGQRTTGSGTTHLKSVIVEPDEVIELRGWDKERTFLGAAAQLGHAAIDAGIARSALFDAIHYARTKARPVYESGVDRATDDHYVLLAVGEMSVLVNSAHAMLTRAANILDIATSADGDVSRSDLDQRFIEASIAVAEAKAVSNNASLKVSEMVYSVGGASATLRKYNLDRHWRNARTHTTHDPVAYKYRAIGEYLLNDKPPPISTKI